MCCQLLWWDYYCRRCHDWNQKCGYVSAIFIVSKLTFDRVKPVTACMQSCPLRGVTHHVKHCDLWLRTDCYILQYVSTVVQIKIDFNHIFIWKYGATDIRPGEGTCDKLATNSPTNNAIKGLQCFMGLQGFATIDVSNVSVSSWLYPALEWSQWLLANSHVHAVAWYTCKKCHL